MSVGRRVYYQRYCETFNKLFGAYITVVAAIFRHGDCNNKQQTNTAAVS